MAGKFILHMLTPLKHVSPFDVNMALDSGFDVTVPYVDVAPEDVYGLVQDTIFSRPPMCGPRTGLFFAGRDAVAALDSIETAQSALVPPFSASLFADPAGAFTTAAAMVAKVEQLLRTRAGRRLEGRRLVVFGATGVVGYASGVLAALQGAEVTLAGHLGVEHVVRSAAEIAARFGVTVQAEDGTSDAQKEALLNRAEIVLCAAKAGVQVLSAAQLAAAPGLLVVADVNAVPPPGVEGLGALDDGVTLPGGAAGIGALAIGHIKYQTQRGLFRRMIGGGKTVSLDFRDAFTLARELAAD